MNHEEKFFGHLDGFTPFWMNDPDEWVWQQPDGTPQGFGLHWRHHGAGWANLLWLSMSMSRCPRQYSARDNGLYVTLVLHAQHMRLEGLPLIDQAGSLTFEQFCRACARGPLETVPPVPNILPVLKTLIHQVHHAHP